MSYKYSITIRLDAPYNEETIQTVLARGDQLDIIYYKFGDEEGTQLNAKDAARSAFRADNEDELHCLDAKIEGVYTGLHFIEHHGKVTVMLTEISYEGLKKFQYDHEDIDIARYAKILLDLTQDFRILEMNIGKS